jgi:hypothetical protein
MIFDGGAPKHLALLVRDRRGLRRLLARSVHGALRPHLGLCPVVTSYNATSLHQAHYHVFASGKVSAELVEVARAQNSFLCARNFDQSALTLPETKMYSAVSLK